MKRNLILIAIAIVSAGFMSSCGSSKPVSVTDSKAMNKNLNEEAEVEISTPCSGPDFQSSKDLIRATGIGESIDQQMAKRMARSAVLEDLGTKIKVSVNAVIKDYYNSRKQNLTEDLERKFEGETDLVVKESVAGYRTLCEKFTRNKANQSYKCYLAIEIGRDDLSKSMYNKLTDKQILRIDYDYEKFQEKFNAEMDKAADK